MLFDYAAEYKHVRIRPLEEKDIEQIRIWRNNPQFTCFLRDLGEITSEMQKKWYESDLKDTTSCTFAIEEISDLNRLVGSVAIYGIDGDKAEIGKILVGDPEAKGKKIGYFGLLLAMHIGYQKLGINNYYGDVHEDNMSAKTNDLRAGFIVTGQHPYEKGGVELEMILPKEHFYEVHNFSDEFMISRYRFEKYKVGDTGNYTKTVTVEDIMDFARISGDFNPVHMDDEEAKKTVFGKRICHGMLSGSIISTVIGTIMPGPGTIYMEQNLKFVKPVYPGDEITACVTIREIVTEKRNLIIDTNVVNQNNEVVIKGYATVRV